MKSEYLINSLVVLILYLAVYVIIIVDILNYYKNNINNIVNVNYINISCLFIAYILLVQFFFQLYSFTKSIIPHDKSIFQVFILSVLFVLFFVIVYVGYALYIKNPIYLLFVGIGLIALLIILFFSYKLISNLLNPKNNIKKYPDISTSTKKVASDPIRVLDVKKTNIFENMKNYLISLHNRIKLELTILPNSVKMLLGAEVILIGLYLLNKFGVSKLGDLYKPKGIYLAKEPLELSKMHNIGSYESIKNKLHSNVSHSYNYGLSLWLLIKPSGQVDVFSNIFNYGYNPSIEYNETNNTLRVIMTDERDNKKIIYETSDYLIQRWNHIVINYYGNYFDVILNGELVGTGKNIAPYLKEDALIIGNNENCKGTIKDVVYFSKPLSLGAVKRISDVFYANNSSTSVESDFKFGTFRDIFNYIYNYTSNIFTSTGYRISDKTEEIGKDVKNVIIISTQEVNKVTKDIGNTIQDTAI